MKIPSLLFGPGVEPARNVIPPSILVTPQDPWPFDRAKAKALLVEAGYPDGFETTLVDTFALGGGAPGVPTFSELFTKDLAAVGIRVRPVVVKTFDEFLRRLAKGEYDLSISGWTADTGSAADWLESNLSSTMTGECPACNNTWNFADAELDWQLVEARAKKSQKAISTIVEIAYREIPFVPIASAPMIGAWNKRVGGCTPSPAPNLPLRDAMVR